MLVHRRVNPSTKFSGSHLYTWVERGTCLVLEQNAMCPARARTRTARSWDQSTNHEAAAPPYHVYLTRAFMLLQSLFRPSSVRRMRTTLECAWTYRLTWLKLSTYDVREVIYQTGDTSDIQIPRRVACLQQGSECTVKKVRVRLATG